MFKIPRFVSRKILVTDLNDSVSVLMFHIKPSVLSQASDPRSKLPNFGHIYDDGNDFNTLGKSDINLVSRNR